MSEPPPYMIGCTAGVDPTGTWVIQARIEYPGDPPPEGSDLASEARAEMLLVIAGAGLEGRERGHDQVLVFMDEGRGEVTELRPGQPPIRHRKQ